MMILDAVIDRLAKANYVVIGTPIYLFGILVDCLKRLLTVGQNYSKSDLIQKTRHYTSYQYFSIVQGAAPASHTRHRENARKY